MSWLTGLKKVGDVLKIGVSVASSAAPIIGLVPGGAVVVTVLNAITMAESVVTQAGSGGVKKEAVLVMLKTALPQVDPVRLSQAVDLIVAALNILTNAQPSGNIQTGTITPQPTGPGAVTFGVTAG